MKYIYSPDSYFLLLKSDWHQEHNLFRQEDYPDRIALGGVYESIREDGEFIYTEKNGKILRSRMIPYEEGKYSFIVGQYVLFNPICSDLEIKSLTYNDNLIIGNKYLIKRVINSFYLQLINEYGDITNPIRFCDVKPVL